MVSVSNMKKLHETKIAWKPWSIDCPAWILYPVMSLSRRKVSEKDLLFRRLLLEAVCTYVGLPETEPAGPRMLLHSYTISFCGNVSIFPRCCMNLVLCNAVRAKHIGRLLENETMTLEKKKSIWYLIVSVVLPEFLLRMRSVLSKIVNSVYEISFFLTRWVSGPLLSSTVVHKG